MAARKAARNNADKRMQTSLEVQAATLGTSLEVQAATKEKLAALLETLGSQRQTDGATDLIPRRSARSGPDPEPGQNPTQQASGEMQAIMQAMATRLERCKAVRAAIDAEGLGETPFTAPRHPTPPEGSAT